MAITLRDFVEDLSMASAVQYVGESARAIDAYITSPSLTPIQQRFLRRTADLLEQWEMAALDLLDGTYSPRLSLTLTTIEAARLPADTEPSSVGDSVYGELAADFRRLSQVCRGLPDGEQSEQTELKYASEKLSKMRLALIRGGEALGSGRRLM